jgi:hypothetical protein
LTAYSFRRFYRRDSKTGVIIPILIIGILVVIAYYAYQSALFTTSFGLIGALSQARQRVSTAVKSGVTFLSGIFGMFVDAITGFSNAVIQAALDGNIAAWVWLVGYLMILTVLIWNYIATGGQKVIR